MKLKLSDKAIATIKAVAPGLAAALGGPLAGAAAGALVSALGGDEKAAEAALLTQDPATLLALRKAEQEFAVRMRELDIEPERLASIWRHRALPAHASFAARTTPCGARSMPTSSGPGRKKATPGLSSSASTRPAAPKASTTSRWCTTWSRRG